MSETILPNEWIATTLKDICILNPKNDLDDELDVGFLPMSGVPVNFGEKNVFETKQWSEVKKGYTHFADGDTIFAKITPCFENSKAAIIENFPNGYGSGSTEYFVLRPIGRLVNPKLLLGLVRTSEFLREGASNMSGSVGHKRVPKEFVENYIFPLPPLAEQQQIAQKLDELLAQVDTLKTRLDAIPNILKRFRQSVLAAAVSGRLTEEWRGENHAPLWRNVPLGEISTFQNGFAFKSEWFSSAGDCQVMKLGNIKNDGLRFETSPAFVDNNTAELHKKYKPDYEDILITMTGTKYKRDYGFTCIVPKNTQILINQRVGRIISDKSQVIPRYLLIFLQSKIFLDEFFKGETGGVNQGNVGSEHIKSCSVALPLLEEQTEIVRRVEQLFAYADQIEQRVKDAQSRVNHLTQSILAKAFRGELTAEWRAQNPELISGENSAAALLERIRVEREAAVKPKRKGK